MYNQVYEQVQTLPEGIVNNIHKFSGKHALANLIQDFKDEIKIDTDFNIFDELFKTDFIQVDTEQLPAYIEHDMSAQIDHNINVGLIELTGEGEFRYSWRGCFYLWFQMVKDMVLI